MFDTAITMCGNVLTAPEWRRTANTGTYVMTFRFASTSRRFDRSSNQWVDGDSLRVRVACWRTLGQNASESIHGDPLVIYGRLYSRDWVDSDGRKRTSYELDAISLGHDMSRGVSHFARRKPAGATDSVDDAEGRATIGGELSEHVEAPARPAGLPSMAEMAGTFDPDRFDIRPILPDEDETYGRGAMSRDVMGRGAMGSDDSGDDGGDDADSDGVDDGEVEEIDDLEAEMSIAA